MQRILSVPVVALFALAVGGCATILGGGNETVMFRSEPEGVTVRTLEGQVLGTTPFTTELELDEDYTVVFSQAGFAERTLEIDKEFNKMAILNVLCFFPGMLICGAIDFVTGNIWTFDEVVMVTLQPETSLNRTDSEVQLACRVTGESASETIDAAPIVSRVLTAPTREACIDRITTALVGTR